jgi:putative ABC transport system permease protein
MHSTWRSIQYALRSLVRARGFTVVAVLTLVLGIGANAAIFSAVEAILLHPLPLSNADRVVFVSTYLPKTNTDVNVLTPAEFQDVADRKDLFASVGAYNPVTVNVTGDGDPERVEAMSTAGALFDVLNIKPSLGRLYDSSDVRANRRVVMLSYEYWMRRTGGAIGRDALGTAITLDDTTYTIVGVLPRGFDFPHGVSIWSPRQLRPGTCAKLDRDRSDPLSHNCKYATTVARLRDDVDITRARVAVAEMMTRWRQTTPAYYANGVEQTLHVRPLITVVAGELRPILLLLFAASTFVLLIACVNVACLQLVRTTTRLREVALRQALGATRLAIASQIIAETTVIALLGGVGGIFVGRIIITTAKNRLTTLPVDATAFRLNPFVLAFSLGVVLLTVFLCAVAPILRAASVDPGDVLRAIGTRTASVGRRRTRFLSAAVVVQVAAALVLVAGCTMTVESLSRLSAVDPGFRADGLVSIRLLLRSDRYRGWAKTVAFASEFDARVRAIPGVRAIAIAAMAPYDAERGDGWVAPATPAGDASTAHTSLMPFFNMVSSNYFDVVGARLIGGRVFDESDVARFHSDTAIQVGSVIIDETLARQLYPNGDAIGKKLGPREPMPTIVGVVNPIREAKLATSGVGNLYYPGAEFLRERTFVIRTSLPFAAIATMLRAIVHQIDPDLPIKSIVPVRADIARSLAPRRVASNILGGFAGLALLLAMLGVYGVLSYAVTQRRKEMGIRLALGANPRDLRRFIVGGVARLALAGIALGLIVFIAGGRYLDSLIYGVSPHDPLTIVGCALTLGVLALIATWIPARSASRLDPAGILRAE